MSDLQCPMRVHLGEDPHGDRIARVLDGAGRAPERIAEELRALADDYRGEAVQVVLDERARAAVVRLLTGSDRGATLVEGDSDGWRVVPTEASGIVDDPKAPRTAGS